ncbi:MAG: 50S ribosomal protein L32 [Eubacteriales bacterium]|jgi:large subunit ribosomal protein L32|nr:50S ribosomal protein L32 [Eubacteriales bacterium]
MALPKRKLSKQRTAKKRACWKLETPNLVECPQCHALKKQHVVCKECGYYDRKEVIKVVEEK